MSDREELREVACLYASGWSCRDACRAVYPDAILAEAMAEAIRRKAPGEAPAERR